MLELSLALTENASLVVQHKPPLLLVLFSLHPLTTLQLHNLVPRLLTHLLPQPPSMNERTQRMRVILTTLALVNARVRLLAYHTMHILNRVLNVLLLKHQLRVLKLPQPIYQHAKNMRVVGFVHGQVQKTS